MKKWEADGNVGSLGSPDEMFQEIARLQQTQVLLLQKQGQASTSARISSDALRQQSDELTDLKLQLSVVQEKYNEQSEQLKRVNKLLSLVTTEGNGLRLLNSYDGGDPTNYAPQLSSRAQQAEEQLQACTTHIEQLENDLEVSIEKASEQTLKYDKLKIAYDQLKQSLNKKQDEENSEVAKQDACDSKAEVEKVTQENKQFREEIDLLESRIEKRNLQGDFDPSKVKVVHLSQNPFMQARRSRSEEMELLKEECDTLGRKLKMLEEGDKSKSAKVERIVIDEASPHEVKDLHARVSSTERKMQRLKEVFSQKIQEFDRLFTNFVKARAHVAIRLR